MTYFLLFRLQQHNLHWAALRQKLKLLTKLYCSLTLQPFQNLLHCREPSFLSSSLAWFLGKIIQARASRKTGSWRNEKSRVAASDLDSLRINIVQYFRSLGVSKRYPKVHMPHIEDRSNNTPDTHHKYLQVYLWQNAILCNWNSMFQIMNASTRSWRAKTRFRMQIVEMQKGMVVKGITQIGITRKGITQMGVTWKGITQIGIRRKGITQKQGPRSKFLGSGGGGG